MTDTNDTTEPTTKGKEHLSVTAVIRAIGGVLSMIEQRRPDPQTKALCQKVRDTCGIDSLRPAAEVEAERIEEGGSAA